MQLTGQADFWHPTGRPHPSNCLAHVHAKTALTATLARFDSAPVGRMARTGLAPPGAAGKCSNHATSGATATDPHRPTDMPQRPSSTALGLVCIQVLSLVRARVSCE